VTASVTVVASSAMMPTVEVCDDGLYCNGALLVGCGAETDLCVSP
jgi:hypothetical protein